jgi:hypothetical protein
MNSKTVQKQTQAVQEGKKAALVSCTIFDINDIHICVHHDKMYESDQQDATV